MAQGLRAGSPDRAGHVGHAVVHDPVHDVGRVFVCRGFGGVAAAALVDADPTIEPLAGLDADPAAEVQIGLQEIDEGGLYRTVKIMGIVLQFGAASLAVRVVGEPILDRFVRSRC